MTREHKLALIVGFALVLVLAVLFSDHLSKARSVEQSSELQVASSKQVGASPKGLKPPAQIIESETAAAAGTTRVPLPGVAPQPALVAQTDGPTAPLPPTAEPTVVRTAAPADPALPHDQFEMVPDLTFAKSELSAEIAGLTDTVGPGGKPLSSQPMKRHDVREGESAFSIARSVYGDGTLWPKLRDYNKGKIADNGAMRSGVTLMLPPRDVLLGEAVLSPEARLNPQPTVPGAKPGPTPAKPDSRDARPGRDTRVAGGTRPAVPGARSAFSTYTVKKGDVLEQVARRTLGSAGRWRDIADANRGVDPNSLKVGQQLRIPAR